MSVWVTNMTHNGFENNKEHLIALTKPSVVAQFAADFESEWATAETVTQELVDDMMARYRKREDTKDEKQRQRSRSKSLSRTTSRSLSSEFKDVTNGA